MDKLPVLRTSLETYLEIRRNGAVLFRALLLPTVALALVDIAEVRIADSLPTRFVFWVLYTVLITIFSVICHRVVILGASSLPNAWGISWGGRQTSFFLWCVLFGICTYLLTWLSVAFFLGLLLSLFSELPFAASVMYLVVIVLAAYFSARLGMVFPAVAVDRQVGLTFAWNLTAGQGFRVLAAIVIPIVIPLLAISAVARFMDDEVSFATYLVLLPLLAFFWTVSIAAISVAYRSLVDVTEEDTGD